MIASWKVLYWPRKCPSVVRTMTGRLNFANLQDDEFEFEEVESEESILLQKTKLSIATKKGNYLQFNLRWANGKGIQNPVWQINPVTKTGKNFPLLFYVKTRIRQKSSRKNYNCSLLLFVICYDNIYDKQGYNYLLLLGFVLFHQ